MHICLCCDSYRRVEAEQLETLVNFGIQVTLEALMEIRELVVSHRHTQPLEDWEDGFGPGDGFVDWFPPIGGEPDFCEIYSALVTSLTPKHFLQLVRCLVRVPY